MRFDWFEIQRSRDQVRVQPCPHPTAIIAIGYHSYVEIAIGYDAFRGSISHNERHTNWLRRISRSDLSPRTQVPRGLVGSQLVDRTRTQVPRGLVDSQLYFFFHPSLGGECVY